MNRRSSHASKNFGDRARYQKAIAKLDSDPTLDESLDFDSSFKIGPSVIEKTSRKKRPIPFYIRLKNIVSEYWFQALFTFITLSIGWLLIESKIQLSAIEKDIEIQQQHLNEFSNTLDDNDLESRRAMQVIQDDINSLREKVENSSKADNAQDILLAEIQLRIEFILDQISQ